jgi:hypothetical protein
MGQLTPPRSHRVHLLLAVALFLSGCTAMKPVRLPTGPGEPPADEVDVRIVHKGQTAAVYLKTGEKVEGEVMAADTARVVLGSPSNYGYREDVYLAEDIERIETAESTMVGSIVGGVFSFVGITMFALIALLAIFPPDLGGLD